MVRASKASTAPKKSATKKSVAKKAAAKRASGDQGAAKVAKATKAAKVTKAKAAAKAGAASKATKTAKVTKAAPKKAAKAERKRSAFDTRFLERMRKLLLSERETYERQAAQLRAEAESLVADIGPGDVQFDEESGEGDTIAVERGRDLALAARATEMVEEIDHALAKFDEGTYGLCEVSGEPIPEERLEAIPWAREKVEYKVGGFGRR